MYYSLNYNQYLTTSLKNIFIEINNDINTPIMYNINI